MKTRGLKQLKQGAFLGAAIFLTAQIYAFRGFVFLAILFRCILALGRCGSRGCRDLRRSSSRACMDRFPFDIWKIPSRTLTCFDANGARIASEANRGVSDGSAQRGCIQAWNLRL